MDKIYDFKWMLTEIDESLLMMLYNKENKIVGAFQASYILAGDMTNLEIKFANIEDLENFINYATIRFCGVRRPQDVIDIPVRKLKELYEKSNQLLDEERKRIKPSDLDSFIVINGKHIADDYMIEAVNYKGLSEELKRIMSLASNYQKMSAPNRFEALTDINLTNYQVEKNPFTK